MACLEVLDVPSGASSDDVSLLVAQFAGVRRLLLLSHGPSSSGSALVWVAEGADLGDIADALDSHPVAGGLISVRVCSDPMRWVVSSVGSAQLLHISSGAGSAQGSPAVPPLQALPVVPAMPAAPPRPFAAAAAAPATPAVPSPRGAGSRPATGKTGGGGGSGRGGAAVSASAAPGTTAGGNVGGVAAMEAELRELQAQLQQQALDGPLHVPDEAYGGGGGGDGWGWGSEPGGSAEDEWQEVSVKGADRRDRRATGGGVAGPPAGSADGDGDGDGSNGGRNILVAGLAPELDRKQVVTFFKQFGWVEHCFKRPASTYAYLHFQEPEAAAAAIQGVRGKLIPALGATEEIRAELKRPPAPANPAGAARAADRSGWDSASRAPTTKLWVGAIAKHATLDDLSDVFGQFGAIYGLELRRAPEAGRDDQWGFVNFRRLQDAKEAHRALLWQVIPALTGDGKLKVQYRPVT